MARVLVVHDTDPDLYIELDRANDGYWDGPCTGCAFAVAGALRDPRSGAEALIVAAQHINREHR
jgi:hypothetical protein